MTKLKFNNKIILGIALTAICIMVIIEALRMPTFEHRGGSFFTGPGIMPLFLAFSLILMGIERFYKGLKLAKDASTTKTAINNTEINEDIDESKIGKKRLFITLILIIVYIFIFLGRLHYILSSFLFLTVFQIIFGQDRNIVKKVIKSSIISIVVTLIIYFTFKNIFLIPLP